MTENDILISGIRAQQERLSSLLGSLESDTLWEFNKDYYGKALNDIEKSLKEIRESNLEPVSFFGAYCFNDGGLY